MKVDLSDLEDATPPDPPDTKLGLKAKRAYAEGCDYINERILHIYREKFELDVHDNLNSFQIAAYLNKNPAKNEVLEHARQYALEQLSKLHEAVKTLVGKTGKLDDAALQAAITQALEGAKAESSPSAKLLFEQAVSTFKRIMEIKPGKGPQMPVRQG